MRTVGRPAAIAATSLALVFAAAGTSVAAVRAARQDGVVARGERASPARGPAGGRAGQDGRQGGAPVAGPEGSAPPASAGTGAAAGAADQGGPAPAGGTASTSTAGDGVTPSAGPPPEAGAPPAVRTATGTTNAPAGAPGSAAAPGTPIPVACPSDAGVGALPPAQGELRAVDFSLPWPGLGPLVLAPQSAAPRAAGAPVSVSASTVGDLAVDRSSLTLLAPLPTTYTLAAGQETASGSIRFTAMGPTAPLDREACRDRSVALYDVARASLQGSPLRIVGFVARTSTVTLGADGGTAHFRSAAPGVHQVVLLTANDLGVAGPVLTATVTVR
jgi:hypothetical protein